MADTMTVDREGLQNLLEKVYRERGFDFRAYKESVLTRRLGRRLRDRGTQSYADYSCMLDKEPVPAFTGEGEIMAPGERKTWLTVGKIGEYCNVGRSSTGAPWQPWCDNGG